MLQDKNRRDNSGMTTFSHPYMVFDQLVEPYQRADDVGYIISEFMWFEGRPFYPISALANAKVTYTTLSDKPSDGFDEDNVDVIFRMPGVSGGCFFEIVLRSDAGTFYGGWLWGQELEVLNEVINGYRVLLTRYEHNPIRFEFSEKERRYLATDHLPFGKFS